MSELLDLALLAHRCPLKPRSVGRTNVSTRVSPPWGVPLRNGARHGPDVACARIAQVIAR
jgi:hypothetical protein